MSSDKRAAVKTEKKPLCPHKKTDFRYQVWLRDRKAMYAKARKSSFRIEMGKQPRRAPVSIDTSKARSNIDVVRLCLRQLGWREYPFGKRDGGHCDIYWNSVHFSDCTSNGMEIEGGKVNKFPGMVEVVRKVNLGRSLDLLHSLFPGEYNFHPVSWFLPQQLPEFHDKVRRIQEKTKTKPVFIVKPDEGSQGDGIYLITDPKEYTVTGEKKHIVQEYISNPLLIERLKFDFRVYVVVTSLDPLEVYISKEGLARFCTLAYEKPTNKNIHEAYMHLTNYSLNKKSETYVHTECLDDGSKRTITSVFKKLRRMGMNTENIWEEIKRVVVKTMIAIVTELRVEYRAAIPPSKGGPSCFQILGFDILLSEGGKPYLLEVNANPSLRIDYEHEVAPGICEYLHSPVDEEIKRPLVLDTLILITPPGKQIRLPSAPTPQPTTNGRRTVKVKAKPKVKVVTPDSESDDSEWETQPVIKSHGVLEQIYPAHLESEYSWLCIMDSAAEIFLDCLGVRGSLRMGSTAFRTFTRKCKVTGAGSGFTNAMLDIMYIDLLRRWDHHHPERGAGLCYQGFIEAFFHIAKKKYPSNAILQSVQTMLDHCEKNLDYGPNHKPKFPMIQKVSKRDQKIDNLKSVYGGSNRQKLGSSYYLDYKKFPVEPRKGARQTSRVKEKEPNVDKNGNVVEVGQKEQ